MALNQDKAKLKRLINQKDRTEFIQEFIKFKDTYFNGNFKNASIAIGESREKVGGIFDRAGVPQGGQGSLLTETIKTPKSVTKIQDLTTRLKKEPDFLKNQKKFKNLKGKFTAKDIGNLLEVDTSTKRNIDDLTATLKELGVKSSVVTGNIKEYDIKDTINKMSTGFLNKRVKGDVKDKTIRRGLERKADPNLHRFFESLKGQIRSSSKEAGVYVPRANEDIGHSMSVVLQDKYPKLFKNSNVNTLSTFMYQDPVVNTTVLTKTGYDSNFDKILKDLNKLVNKPVTAESQRKLLNLKKQLDTNHKSVINLIKNPDQLKLFLSKYPDAFNVKGMDLSYLKGQEKRIPKIDIKIPSVGEVFKSENLYADMSNTDPAFRIGNVDQINSNARTLKDLNLNERQLFRENVINQNVDNLSKFYTAVGYPKDEIVELTDTLITGGERSQGLSGTKSGIEKINGARILNVLKTAYADAGKGSVIQKSMDAEFKCADGCFIKVANSNPQRIIDKVKKEPQKLIRLFRGESFPQRNIKHLKETAKHFGTTLAEMKKDTLSGQWFTPNQAHAASYLATPGKMKYVDVTPAEFAAMNKYKDRINKTNVKWSEAALEGKPFKQNITTSPHHQVIPRYKLKQMEEAGRLKSKLNINPFKKNYAGALIAGADQIVPSTPGVLEYNRDLGAFVDSRYPTQKVSDLQIKNWAAENPINVKAGTEDALKPIKGNLLKTVGKSLAYVGAPLPTALIDSYFIGKQISEDRPAENIAKDPLNWLGLATMSTLSDISGVSKPGKINTALRLGMSPGLIRGVSRFAGLPGLAISTALTAYDQYQKYQNEEGLIYDFFNKVEERI